MAVRVHRPVSGGMHGGTGSGVIMFDPSSNELLLLTAAHVLVGCKEDEVRRTLRANLAVSRHPLAFDSAIVPSNECRLVMVTTERSFPSNAAVVTAISQLERIKQASNSSSRAWLASKADAAWLRLGLPSQFEKPAEEGKSFSQLTLSIYEHVIVHSDPLNYPDQRLHVELEAASGKKRGYVKDVSADDGILHVYFEEEIHHGDSGGPISLNGTVIAVLFKGADPTGTENTKPSYRQAHTQWRTFGNQTRLNRRTAGLGVLLSHLETDDALSVEFTCTAVQPTAADLPVPVPIACDGSCHRASQPCTILEQASDSGI